MAQGISTKSARQNAVKSRTVDFCDTLADILRKAKTEQHKNRFRYGELYHLNYCKTVKEKGRTYYEVYSLQRTQGTPEDDRELSFVCLKRGRCFCFCKCSRSDLPQGKGRGRGIGGLSFPHTPPYLHKQSAFGRCKTQRCAGTSRTR